MQIRGSYYKVVTTDGNKTLGGSDIDKRLAQLMTDIFQKQNTDPAVDFGSPEFQQILRNECEKAKRMLSSKDNYTLEVSVNVANQGDIILTHFMERSDFQGYISDILHAMIKPLDSLLSRGNTTRAHIVDLYLVGGVVQIPKLQKLLRKYFPKVTPDNIHFKDPVQVLQCVIFFSLFFRFFIPLINTPAIRDLESKAFTPVYHPCYFCCDFKSATAQAISNCCKKHVPEFRKFKFFRLFYIICAQTISGTCREVRSDFKFAQFCLSIL
jgi:hypothetical protein